MAEYLRNITEEDTIKCNVCNKTFRTDLITLDDWNFGGTDMSPQIVAVNVQLKF